MYYIYMLRCDDNSIYTGITVNIEKRMNEHFSKDKNCAKYTLSHNASKLEILWKTETKQLASKLEYHIKRLKKEQKEKLIKNSDLLEKILGNKIESEKYEKEACKRENI